MQHGSQIAELRPDELPKILELMQQSGLTKEGLDDAELFVARDEEKRIIGSAGLEMWGKRQGLLRSLVVTKELRGKGIGSSLVLYVLETARRRGLEEVFLLTTDVPEYYLKFGFKILDRKRVEGEVLNSAEFRGACLDTAVVMKIKI